MELIFAAAEPFLPALTPDLVSGSSYVRLWLLWNQKPSRGFRTIS